MAISKDSIHICLSTIAAFLHEINLAFTCILGNVRLEKISTPLTQRIEETYHQLRGISARARGKWDVAEPVCEDLCLELFARMQELLEEAYDIALEIKRSDSSMLSYPNIVECVDLLIKVLEEAVLTESQEILSFSNDDDLSGTCSQAITVCKDNNTWIDSFGPELIFIPAGDFLMGSDLEKDVIADDDEQPQHSVYLSDYYIAKTPVTNVQYKAFVKATGYKMPAYWIDGEIPPGKELYPVIGVNWEDVLAYCHWLAEATGKPYRLPTEAEWEKAARGTDGRIYPWGNEWCPELCHTMDSTEDITPVGNYSPQSDSPYGCADMACHIWEWTSTLYKKYPYHPDDGREAMEAEGYRILRGGGIYDPGWYSRCAVRLHWYPRHPLLQLRGIRLAMTSKKGKMIPVFQIPKKQWWVLLSPDGDWGMYKEAKFMKFTSIYSVMPLLPLLEIPYSTVMGLIQTSLEQLGIAPIIASSFPYEALICRALTWSTEYWPSLALDWLEAGYGVTKSIADCLERMARNKSLSKQCRDRAFKVLRDAVR